MPKKVTENQIMWSHFDRPSHGTAEVKKCQLPYYKLIMA